MAGQGDSGQAQVSSAFAKQLSGYGLTTAEILYRMPDHPLVLQSFLWQDYDLAPEFPTLMKFLTFWREKLDGPLYSVRIGHSTLIKPAEIRSFGPEFRLH
ncbi:usg protein [uncultured Methylovirgula sp.]|uniref:usg protein n=1 Tax=uncultured Methylovirgula sp. TaxID=1285960 RepID=UPI00261E814B|nr:usg protein [uncultured Methylovirgula sp.]